MFPPSNSPAQEHQVLRATMAAQGFSVVEDALLPGSPGATSEERRETAGSQRVRRSE
jgi:hypothetical protein